jgi:hypothetical protein
MCGDNENVKKGLPEWFLGALAKLQKETVSFIMSVLPSAWNIVTPTGQIFMKFGI